MIQKNNPIVGIFLAAGLLLSAITTAAFAAQSVSAETQKDLQQIAKLITPEDVIENDNGQLRISVRGDGQFMFLEGTLNSTTPDEINRTLAANPNIKWAVLTNVPGSMDDDANLRASRMIRDRGINTFVPMNGSVASGGTDLFLSGKARYFEKGAKLGVHSWFVIKGFWLWEKVVEGRSYPRDSPLHQSYLSYYKEMGIPADFYWYTLEKADAHNMYNMNLEDIARFNLGTAVEPLAR